MNAAGEPQEGGSVRSFEGLVQDDRAAGLFRVHRSAMTSPEVFAAERRKVFDRNWLYMGHESEIPRVGDFVRRTVNGRPLFMTRGSDGRVRVFLNSCPHRGALICRQPQGHATSFQCFYHAWTFGIDGELKGVPSRELYPDEMEWSEFALRPPAGVDTYRGFVFVTFDPDADGLRAYLAGAVEYIDLVVDQAEDGWSVLPGTNMYQTRSNWKLMVENSVDTYHVSPLHRTYFDYVGGLRQGGPPRQVAFSGRGPAELGNGHVVVETHTPYGRPIAHWDPVFGEDARPEIEAIRDRLVQRHGAERAARMADNIRLLLIYPNLLLNDITAVTIRYVQPLAPGLHETTAWALAPNEETEAARARRIDSYLTFVGPGGFATPDDVEAVESCQAGFEATELEWSDLSLGGTRPAEVGDETALRAFWRRWHHDLLAGSDHPVAAVDPARRAG